MPENAKEVVELVTGFICMAGCILVPTLVLFLLRLSAINRSQKKTEEMMGKIYREKIEED
jgi:hypothetical protein